ncbi:hypothetical protein [Rhizobium leguminosarum]|uniref:hypothetical protein n=1 Tax=Rhizobium leguminosarum TaxID=384 RepID=UPI001FE1C7D3|nr:hypothetical protein [Rhizobium leguminosarum]
MAARIAVLVQTEVLGLDHGSGQRAAGYRLKTPQELMQHNCINRRVDRLGGQSAWEFEKNSEDTV